MFRVNRKLLKNLTQRRSLSSLPEFADVVIIGGGAIGCNTLYYLSKKNVNAVLLERGKLTSGTTWHTSGVIWTLRPSDVDIQLLATTRSQLASLESETGLNPGWINNGGLFISHSPQRTNEYKRLQTLGKCFGFESEMLTANETTKLFPFLDPKAFECSLYSKYDGVIDPTMMVNAIAKGAKLNGGKIFEDCEVEELVVEENYLGEKEVQGVKTKNGTIKSNIVVNATGVWGSDLLSPFNIHLPLIPFKHSYIVSESIPGLHQMMPNVRDHDNSIVFRIQGQAFNLGGYERNPIFIDKVPKDFQFQLYELDYSTYEEHIENAMELIPIFREVGIKSTVCGPESFTADHRCLMGPDPFLHNLFHNCGYNSAGIMYGAGCAKQLAHWIVHGSPELPMEQYDVRRFSKRQRSSYEWIKETSHEAYATNYGICFPKGQTMAGRNFEVDSMHELMLKSGAIMEEKFSFERPAFFITDGGRFDIPKYDFYGFYGNELNQDKKYEEKVAGDCKFELSDHHEIIASEAKACRENAALFNLSSFTKFFIVGPQAAEAVEWIFTSNIADRDENEVIQTFALNSRGFVEAELSIIPTNSENGRSFYCISDGSSSTHTISHIREGILEKKFDAKVLDVTKSFGILTIQGRNSGKVLSKIAEIESLALNSSKVFEIDEVPVRILRKSSIGEFGFELHIPSEKCPEIYEKLMKVGESFKLSNGGFRAFNSLAFEAGSLLWSHDLRSDVSPLDLNSNFADQNPKNFKGKSKMQKSKSLIFITLESDEKIPLWGLEAVYRNGKIVGHLRRGDWSFTLDKAIGNFYVESSMIDEKFLSDGKFEIEVMGKILGAKASLKASFEDEGKKRMKGEY